MALLHEYENRLIRLLPPNAQHIAEIDALVMMAQLLGKLRAAKTK